MKNLKFILAILLIGNMILLTSCKKNSDITDERELFDCPDLQANIGDPCDVNLAPGVINGDCECELPVTYDCDSLQLNVGAFCTYVDSIGNVYTGFIDADCLCAINTSNWNCPDLQANIGDPCDVNLAPGIINGDCECELPVTYDCPDSQANFGDPCTDPAGGPGFINANCDCEAQANWDCDALQLNIGDQCSFGVNQIGIVDADCNCVEPAIFDCPTLGLNIGDACTYTVIVDGEIQTYVGAVSDNCNCE